MGVSYYYRTNWWTLNVTLADLLLYSYLGYAGNAFFGLSWLFFVAAAVLWTFWGIIQYAKSKGIVMAPFSTADSVGISIKF